MDALGGLAGGFAIALGWQNLLWCLLGAVVGTAIGVLPGLGPPATIALLLPVTYGMPATSAVILLAGIFYGAMYGGSTTSILLNIPGEAASVVTCLDGHAMARQGRAGSALAIAAVGSFVAGTVSLVGLVALAPPLAAFALRFGAPETAALLALGLVLASQLGTASLPKGLAMVALGLLLGTVGLDPVEGTPRFTLGVVPLTQGFEFVIVAMGLFGIGEVLANLEDVERREPVRREGGGFRGAGEDWRRAGWPTARGSVLGFLVGVLPGGGAVVASFLAYAVERRVSRTPEAFGRGAVEGVAGPEAANNAAATSSFVPLLTLGIPGNASIALIFAALMIHGIRPGPTLLAERPDVFWGLIASMYLGNAALLVLNLPLVGLWARLLRVPYGLLAPVVLVVVLVGAYSVNNSVFDVGTAVACGVAGWLLRRAGFELGPLVLALVLGPQLEAAIRRALIWARGDPALVVARPIALVLLGLALLALLGPPLWRLAARTLRGPARRPS